MNNLGKNGHLGNQMFQLSSLIGIANNLNYEWVIPPEYHANDPLSNIYQCFDMNIDITKKIILNPTYVFNERYYHFDEEFYNQCSDNTDLNGYFQSYKYFEKYREELLSLFSFKEYIVSQGNSIMSELDSQKTVAIHVRRSDYTQLAEWHTNLGLDYYSRAIENFSDYKKIVLSDDIEWCMTQEIFKDAYFVKSLNPYVDFYIMTMCNGNIIANSSFSWWGAWLNKNNDKIVVAPQNWFGPSNAHNDTKDLTPEEWIKI